MRITSLLIAFLLLLPMTSAQQNFFHAYPSKGVSYHEPCVNGETRCDGTSMLQCVEKTWRRAGVCGESCVGRGCYKATIDREQYLEVSATRPGHMSGGIIKKDVMEVTKGPWKKLACPQKQAGMITPPAPFYDEKQGDCALVGKRAKIEEYLKRLEYMAKACHARRMSAWRNALHARIDLDRQINALKPPAKLPAIQSGAMCPVHYSREDMEGHSFSLDRSYAGMLSDIADDVADYCAGLDELVTPLSEWCAITNKGVGCLMTNAGGVTDEAKAFFHTALAVEMDALMADRDRVSGRYNAVINGIKDFRKRYDEKKACPERSTMLTGMVSSDIASLGSVLESFTRWLSGLARK
jgi:hypothetical protein